MGACRIVLPWPAPALWANRRPHYMARARAIANQRNQARILAQNARVGDLGTTTPRLRFTFHPPPKSRPDIQNMPHVVKGAIDGIADAMGCDDRGFRPEWPEAFGERKRGGEVVIEVMK